MSGMFILILMLYVGGLIYATLILTTIWLILAFIFSFIIGFAIALPITILGSVIVASIAVTQFVSLRYLESKLMRPIMNVFRVAGVTSEVIAVVFLLVILSIIHFLIPEILKMLIIAVIAYTISIFIRVAWSGMPKKIRARTALVSGISLLVAFLVFAEMYAIPNIAQCTSQYTLWKTGKGLDYDLFCYKCAGEWKALKYYYNETELLKIMKLPYCLECKIYYDMLGRAYPEKREVIKYIGCKIFNCTWNICT